MSDVAAFPGDAPLKLFPELSDDELGKLLEAASAHEYCTGDKFAVNGLGEVEVIGSTGDSQLDSGANDEHYIVVRVGERLLLKTGTWVSHDGMYWDDDWRTVTRKLKTVTDWVYEG